MKEIKPSILFISENYPPENFAAAIRVYERGEYWKKWGYFTQFITTFPNRHQGKYHEGYEDSFFKFTKGKNQNILRVKTYIPKHKTIFFRALHQISFMFSSFLGGLFLQKNSVVIVTTPQFFCSFSGLLISRLKRIPLIIEVADIWTNSIKGTVKSDSVFFSLLLRLEEFIYRKSNAIITLTEGFQKEIIERGIKKEKIFVIRNGVNQTNLDPTQRINLRKECGLSDEFIIGYAGSLGPAQGLVNVCDAAEILEKRNFNNIKFIFLGEGDDKELIQSRGKKLNNLIYLGNKNRALIPNYIADFDIGLAHLNASPVWKTTIPSKIFELMASKLPILLVSPKGEASEIVEKYDVGKWVMSGDPELLAKHIEEMIMNKENLAKFAKNSSRTSLTFSREEQSRKVIEVVEKVISSRIKR
jgi:glycosyltransferase involved in cell wall biosynthesis